MNRLGTELQDVDPGEWVRRDDAPQASHVLDVVGLYCPLPIIRIAALIKGLAPGAIVEVLADDPVALEDMPRWCLTSGHQLLGWLRGEPRSVLRFFVRVTQGRLPRKVAR